MKFIIVSLAVIAVVSAQQYSEQTQPPIPIVKQSQDLSPEGNYKYEYETGNGIQVQETGTLVNGPEGDAIVAQGAYQYRDDEGNVFQVSYLADENGFQPQGAHLPVAPPIPEAIQRSLEYIRTHPQPQEQ
ncbi:hypothetical protein G9C98_005854 [Cotesia typhae]|uniref:Uncharacterized protein n=1 Tax=Cotesia typhae TaxID=2053667 RepID=A0A8J5R3J3_9HYME|nr:hypothetical protein G9C98_005854 [Cotesia typhae]